MPDKELYNIIDQYGLPRDEVSCPSCGHLYGTHNRLVCSTCEECSKCCHCPKPNHINPDDFVGKYLLSEE
jgi:hypothetical protein